MNSKLMELGLNDRTYNEFLEKDSDGYLGRVVAEYKGIYKVSTEQDDIFAKVSGKMKNTGDGIIHEVMNRKSVLSRKIAGQQIDEQIIASNIDTVFICMAVNNDFNLRRLERFLSIGWNSGATPVIILTKTDLCHDLSEIEMKIESVAIGIDIVYLSSITGHGVEGVYKYLMPGKTITFIGSSGVGKSTLINLLIGEEKQLVKGIREDDDRGKHTTTHRELILINGKGIVIDTPGMREIQLLDDMDGINDSFKEINDIGSRCKFSDCKHGDEPGCAVKAAIETGEISNDRFMSYKKLIREAQFMERKLNSKSRNKFKNEMVKRTKNSRRIQNNKN